MRLDGALLSPAGFVLDLAALVARVTTTPPYAHGKVPEVLDFSTLDFKSRFATYSTPWIVMILYRYNVDSRQEARAYKVLTRSFGQRGAPAACA